MADVQRRRVGHWKASAGGVIAGAVGVLAVLGAIGLVVVYTGAFNVAATEDHASVVRWAFDTTFRNSVERRADDLAGPERLTPELVASGASAYKAMCQHCHAGPGVERASWAAGMRPRPPHLTERAARWEPREVFWIVKHGVKMTGMPAFGPTHDDRTLWSVAAFVKDLPAMTAERYAALGNDTGGTGGGQGTTAQGGGAQGGGAHGGHPH